MEIKANEGKNINITVDGVEYMRIPCKTKLIMKQDEPKTEAGGEEA